MSDCNHTFHRLGGIDDCPVCNPANTPPKPPRDERLLITEYDQMARVVHLYFQQWCDESIPYPAMCADAVRKAREAYDALARELAEVKEFAARETQRKIAAWGERDEARAARDRLAGALQDAGFVLAGSVAIEGQSDEVLDRRVAALERVLDALSAYKSWKAGRT